MAAFLTADRLRAHAAPAVPYAARGEIAGHAWRVHAGGQRPLLAARWRVAPDGQLTCRWQIDASAPFGPPPQ